MEADHKFSVLAKCQSERFPCLIHGSIDKLLGRKSLSYKDYSDVWNLDDWWLVNDVIEDVCKECGKHNLNKEQIKKKIGSLPEKHQDIFMSALLIRKEEIRQALLGCTTAIAGNYLKDFDWKLKLVLSSDKLATVREPLASLDFDVQTTAGSKFVSVEMNKDELKKMIVSMETANKAVTQLKS